MPIVPSGVRSSMKSRITRGEERGRRKEEEERVTP